MKLKQTALLVCIVYVITAILDIISIINFMLIEKVNFSGMSYMCQFLNIIKSGIVAYFFYLFYRKIK